MYATRITLKMWLPQKSMPTWPGIHHYANILAIMSFTLNRVLYGMVPEQGYNFTITSSHCL